jgi:hypothetical protein
VRVNHEVQFIELRDRLCAFADRLATRAIRGLFVLSPWLRSACSEAANDLYYDELDLRADWQKPSRADVEHDVGWPGDDCE